MFRSRGHLQALIEGERSGEPDQFDFASFKRRKAAQHAEFRLSPRAPRDLEAIFDHTVQQWGLPQALYDTDLIEATCTIVAAAP